MNTTTALRPCAIQFCPATNPSHSVQPWHCALHRWPGGEGDSALTVTALGEDATFVDGVLYIVEVRHTRVLKARFEGKFDLDGSHDSRLRFVITVGQYVEVDPDLLAGVVATG